MSSSSPSQSAERRHLAILFSDLVGSTSLSERMEWEEDYQEVLKKLRPAYEAILSRHGGVLARAQGDGILAIFGYPSTREDDGRRAAEAALELHALVRDSRFDSLPAGVSLRLHTGVHAGVCLVDEGSLVTGRFDLSGHTPNVAHRLSSEAGEDEIVVSEETLGTQSHFFRTGERQLISVRGKSEPIAVVRILGRADTATRFEGRRRRGLAPFVGREHEVGFLLERLEATTAGRPQCVAICGGPGLGKSRLVEQLVQEASAAQWLVLRSYCESYLSAEPLQPFLQMLRTICGLVPRMPAADAAAAAERNLAALPGLSDTARAELLRTLSLARHASDGQRPTGAETIAALGSLFDALSQQRRLMLVVDDVQWADNASQLMLDFIRKLPRPIFVLVATRDAAADTLAAAGTVEKLEIQPLTLREASRTIANLLPEADPFLVAEIHRYAGGNPLFIEELCHFAAAKGGLKSLEHQPGGVAWLQALVESRVGRLPPEQAHIVRAAAVIGNVFPAWLLERVTGWRADDPAVHGLAEQDLLFPGDAGTLRFKHGLTRDAIYEMVGVHQRKSLHFAAATALALHGAESGQQEIFEGLAYHYGAAGVPMEAARYAELAGDKALAATALDRARTQYLAALAAIDQLAPLSAEMKLRWCTVAQKLGMGCVYDPLGLADGIVVFERAARLARETGKPEVMARAEYWLGYMCYARGLGRKATGHCKESLELAVQIGDERLAAQVRATLGQALTATCQYEEAARLFDAAIDTKRRHGRPGSSVAVGSAYTLACKGSLLGDRGLFAEAEGCFKEALALLGGSPHQVGSSVRGWIAVVYMWQGRWDEAVAIADEAASIAEQVHSRQLFAISRSLGGYSRWVLTRDPDALQAVRDATTWIESRNGTFFTSLNYGWLVDGAVALGHTGEARRYAARLLQRARHGERIGEAMGFRALAEPQAQRGDLQRASRYLRQAQRSAEARGSPHEKAKNDVARARIEMSRGRSAEARALMDSACRAFEAMAMPWYLQDAERLRATL